MIWALRYIKGRHIASLEAVVIVLVAFYAYIQHDSNVSARKELETAQVALLHPKTSETVRIVKVAGPVRIITRMVEKPGGEKETTTDEITFGSSEVFGSATESAPVSVAELVPNAGRSDRWLAALDLTDLDYKNGHAYTAYGGYSIHNRVDLLLGVGKKDHWESHCMVVARF